MDESTGRSSTSSRIGGLEQLGRYELICVMARAEYGSTWACMATSAPHLGRVFSLRRIVVSPGDEDQVTQPLLKVAEAWEGVSRPGMLPIVDAVAMSGRLGIVSQYAEGEPLRSVLNLAKLRKLPMPQPVALRIATDLVQSLVNLIGAALKKPELSKSTHGGVLPDVVMLAATGETRISEPGVTAEITKLPTLMRHEKLLAYQAPEQLSGGRIDARTDVFAIGVLLWEMLVGRSLFLSEEGKSDGDGASDATRKRVLEMAASRLDDAKLALETPVDKALADVVERALQKSASSRYSSLQELATAIRKAVSTKAGSRRDVASYLTELVGSTLETRKAAIERASLGAPPEPVPADDAEPAASQRGRDVVPTAGDIDVEVDMDFGDGDDLEELQPEPATGENIRPPVPPRIEIKSAPAKPKWPAPPSLLNDPKTSPRPGQPPRPGASPEPSTTPKPPDIFGTPKPGPAGSTDAATDGDKASESKDAKASESKDAKASESKDAKASESKTDVAEPSEGKSEDATSEGTDEKSNVDENKGDVPEAAEKSEDDEKAPAAVEASDEKGGVKSSEEAPNPFELPFEPAAEAATAEPSPEPPAGRATPIPSGDESDETSDEAPAEPLALAVPDELEEDGAAAAARKRKLTMIVGGVVGLAALLLVIAGIASAVGGSDTPATPAVSATQPPPPETTAAPTATPPEVVQEAGAQTDAQADADAAEDAAEDAAKDAEPEAEAKDTKPPPRRPPRPAKPRPKPYMPSEI
jgi:serine/threonine protein kinase